MKDENRHKNNFISKYKVYFLIFGALLILYLIGCTIDLIGYLNDKNKERQKQIANIELHKEDSIQHLKDSLYLMGIAKKEGNHIFGDFYFGMSKKEFDKAFQKVQRETSGVVRIEGCDFCIDNDWETQFYHDSLSAIFLYSKEFTNIEVVKTEYGGNRYDIIIGSLQKHFKEKYGDLYDQMYHKRFWIGEGEYDTEWHYYLKIENPRLSDKRRAEWEEGRKAYEANKKKEEELKQQKEAIENKKKEAIANGL